MGLGHGYVIAITFVECNYSFMSKKLSTGVDRFLHEYIPYWCDAAIQPEACMKIHVNWYGFYMGDLGL